MYGCADHTRNLSICSESQQTADVAFCIVHHHVTDFFFFKGHAWAEEKYGWSVHIQTLSSFLITTCKGTLRSRSCTVT